MPNDTNREEYYRSIAEKVRLTKEKEEREEREFYERITSGGWWLSFQVVVVFSTLMALATLIDHVFDGPTKKLNEKSWRIDPGWRYDGFAVLDVEGYMFTPEYHPWFAHVENTIELTYTPIFRTGKKLKFNTKRNGDEIVEYVEIRSRSIFTWFPFVQLLLFIPLFTYIFKRQSPWFNFGRIVSYIVVLPSAFMIIFFALL
jgi:hypothetical protein